MVIASVHSLTTIPILVNLYWLCSAPVQHTIRVVVGIVTSVVGIVASFIGLVSSGCVGILVTAVIGIAIRYNLDCSIHGPTTAPGIVKLYTVNQLCLRRISRVTYPGSIGPIISTFLIRVVGIMDIRNLCIRAQQNLREIGYVVTRERVTSWQLVRQLLESRSVEMSWYAALIPGLGLMQVSSWQL
jgi:hypothetical protein